jgi:hypothetical protein
MSFDARSRERLEALGRTLPQRLPAPDPKPEISQPAAARHAVETERNPEQLFRELMRASSDGTVPPHLMDRLRELEQGRATRPQTPAATQGVATQGVASRAGAGKRKPSAQPRRPANAANPADAALYTEFQQLLLEDDG